MQEQRLGAKGQKAKLNCDEMVKRHNSRLFSLSQGFDVIFCSHNIKKEHCHSGKHNGVNCIRTMENAEESLTEFSVAIKEKKVPTVSDTTIDTKCSEIKRAFGLLDAIWSDVRGIDAGLLPADDQVSLLRKLLAAAKELWLNMDMKTRQPK